MFSILFAVIAPVALVVLVGYLWGLRKQPFDAISFSMVSTYVGTPCLVVDSLSTSGLKLSSLEAMGAAAKDLDSLIATWGASEDELMGEYKEIRRAARDKKRNGK